MTGKRFSMLMMVMVGLLLAACGSGGGNGNVVAPPLPPIVMQAPAIADGEGTVVEGFGAFNLTATISMGDSVADQQTVGILCFDLTGVAAVDEAILSFHTVADLGDAWAFQPLHLEHIESDGIIDMAHLSNAALAQVSELTKDGDWALDVTAQVAADIAAGRTTSTFRLRFEIQTDGDAGVDNYRIASSKHVDENVRPALVLTIPQ